MERELEYRIMIERQEDGKGISHIDGNINKEAKEAAIRAFNLGKWHSVEFIKYANNGGIILNYR